MPDTNTSENGVVLGGYTVEERKQFFEAHLKVCKRTKQKPINSPSQSGAFRSLRQSQRHCANKHWRAKLKEEGRIL